MATIILNPAATSSSSSPSPSPSPTTAAAPTITSFTPTTGAAGTSVTLTGTGFSSATAVGFNGTGATFTALSDTQITAAVPTSATSGAITVTNPVGTATSAASFTVSAPTIGIYNLTVGVSGGNWVNPTTGVTVTQTNVTPNLVRTPTPQFPTTGSSVSWSGLAAGQYLVTCNYYKNGKTNGNGPNTVVQTVTITNADQQISFDLTQ
jgi:hypothetical protein